MEVQGITKGKTTTTRRASVKITLGWERVYVFELWIMDHNAEVDVILGMDFMIPAGVRLDLFQELTSQFVVSGRPTRVGLTNLTDRLVLCPTHLAIVAWVPIGTLPKQVGYVRLDSKKYSEWQVLAYEAVRDKTLFRRERELYEEWLAAQPPAVDRPSYTRPKQILRRYLDNSDSDSGGTIADKEAEDSSVDEDPAGSHEVHEGIVSVAISGPPTAGEVKTAHSGNTTSKARGAVHEAPAETKLDYTANNVRNPELSAEQQASLIAVLKNHDKIMIASGNALPPPAYGVVCDIDVGGHAPIKQHARRIPLRQLKKLYDLLKGLLKAGLIAFSDSPWTSPIVIVLKKNGLDIRLCIDYKLVNAVTMIMEYAMPLVDDLLTDLEAYLWFCSLDAASGFWAIMMTMRARKISAFVCPLGHFEWLRMPFGLKNAPMIYQRMIDNALWGFVQPKGGWRVFADRMQAAEERADKSRQLRNEASMHWSTNPQNVRTKFDAAHEDSVSADPVSQLINSPDADMFTTSEADTSTLVPVFDRRSFVDDICFGGKTFDECPATLDKLLSRFEECRISISFTKSIFAQSRLKDDDFKPGGDLSIARRSFAAIQRNVADAPILRHFDKSKDVHLMLFANEWALSTTILQMHDDKLHPVRFCGRVLKYSELNYHPAEKEVLALLLVLKMCYMQLAGRQLKVYTRFSTLDWIYKSKSLFGRASQFAVLLSPWHLAVQRVKEKDCAFTQLLHATITNFVDMDEALAPVAPPKQGSPTTRLGRPQSRHEMWVCVRIASWGLSWGLTWGLASWGLSWGLTWGLTPACYTHAYPYLMTALWSPLMGQQPPRNLGLRQLFLDCVATSRLKNSDCCECVPRDHHAKAQEEELKWANLKAVLRGNSANLGYKAARDAWKVMDQLVLSGDEVLYYEGTSRRKRNDEQAEIALRLVVPTTMIQEVLQNCHDSQEGDHQGEVRTYQRVKLDSFWIGLYADVEKHVRSCPDCSSSKSRPHLRGYLRGNILAELPFQLVSMDFVIPLPTTRRGNPALLLFQCSFAGFVMAKAMSNTDALRVAQAFEECVYRRYR
ncbi:unnamed protein product [Phytophthora fragariaefolia]|uniref:Unnamed protein product n=1 Tax=Phytophthora fragariaefolia TaxID=1490495 RepID=A0A9W6XZT3_9STRA|nr:unnamed protein product [Phytophthora fragariaefolia]